MPDEFQTLKKERCIEIIKACNGSGMLYGDTVKSAITTV